MFEAVVVVVVVDWALLRCAAHWCNHTQDSLHTAASPGESVAEGNFSAVNLWKNCGANYFLRAVSPQWWTRECFAAFRDRMSVFVRFVRVCVFVFIDVTDISCLSIETCSHFRAPALQRNSHNPDWITHCTPNSSGPNVKKKLSSNNSMNHKGKIHNCTDILIMFCGETAAAMWIHSSRSRGGKRRPVWTFLYLVFLLPICFLPAFLRALKKSPKTIDLPNCSGFGAADGMTASRRKNKRRPSVWVKKGAERRRHLTVFGSCRDQNQVESNKHTNKHRSLLCDSGTPQHRVRALYL